MNRRTFLGTAVCGGVGIAGCLDDEPETTGDTSDAEYPRYSRPAYSAWPPADSYGGGGVVYAQLRLRQYPTIRQAIDEGRLDASHPVVGLSVYGSEQLATAVETLTAYPFGDALRQAVAAASRPDDATVADDSRPLVEPVTDPLVPAAEPPDSAASGNTSTAPSLAANESTGTEPDDTESTGTEPGDTESIGTESAGNTSTSTASGNTSAGNTSTSTASGNTSTAPSVAANESAGTEPSDNASAENETTAIEEPDPISPADLGIELDRIALIGAVVLFEGSFDPAEIVDRFGAGFEQVDTQRGLSIYEGTGEQAGLAYALDGSRLLVPAGADGRSVEDETLVAHIMSGYISTVGRIVDTADGEWLFETTGPAALAVGFWETPVDTHLARSTVAAGRPGVGAVFGSVGSCLSAIAVTDDDGPRPAFEGRFSGLYPAGPPSTEDLESALVGAVDAETVYTEPPRAHVTTPLGEQ